MGLSCLLAISGWDWVWVGWVGWDLYAGLFYEHRFAMLKNDIRDVDSTADLVLVLLVYLVHWYLVHWYLVHWYPLVPTGT